MKTLFVTILLLLFQNFILAVEKTMTSENVIGEKNKKDDQNSHEASDKKAQETKKEEEEDPCFVGTLLAFYGENIEPGKLLVQPFFYGGRRYGVYDQNSHLIKDRNTHTYTYFLTLEGGITKNIDLTLDLYATHVHNNQGDTFNFGDIQAFLGFQIAKDKKNSWVPDIRILIGEAFPTGKYNNLDERFREDEATGTGVYGTSLVLIIRKIFYTRANHPYLWNFNFQITHTSPTEISGFNSYGGDLFTDGALSASENFFINIAYEYKFNKRWGCGVDINLLYQNSYSFREETLSPFKGSASSYILSLAPELEYTFNDNVGFSAGVWYSIAGRNAIAFFNGVITAYYTF